MLNLSAMPDATPIRINLAQNLRSRRASLGLSQEALADLAGLHRTFVGSVERSERNLSVDNLARLAAALNIEPSDLLRKPS